MGASDGADRNGASSGLVVTRTPRLQFYSPRVRRSSGERERAVANRSEDLLLRGERAEAVDHKGRLEE